MARYSVIMNSAAITAAQDLVLISSLSTATAETFENAKLSPVAGPGFYVMSVKVRSDSSETPDQVSLGMYVGTTNAGTGTVHTPRPLEQAPPFMGTASTNLTVAASKSPATPVLSPEGDLAGSGLNWEAYEAGDGAVYVGTGQTFVLRLETAPAGSTVLTATVIIEQRG